jgi:hypothetical protein
MGKVLNERGIYPRSRPQDQNVRRTHPVEGSKNSFLQVWSQLAEQKVTASEDSFGAFSIARSIPA